MPDVFDAQHRAALFGDDAAAQLLVPPGDIDVRVMQPQGQVDPPVVATPFHRERHVVALVSVLTGHAPGALLVVVIRGRGSGLINDPAQQLHYVWAGGRQSSG